MLGNFENSLSKLLVHEGGFVNHPADPGGATNLGVTQATLSRWLGRQATVGEVQALTPTKVAPIYKKFYWDVVEGDLLPSGVDHAVFDAAVNSGPYRAGWLLQRALVIPADGDIGNETIQAARDQEEEITIKRMQQDRLNFLRGLKTWRTFGRGWTTRVERVEDEALAMIGREPTPPPEPEFKLPPGFVEEMKALLDKYS